ncbi:MAG TPA: hypothetical protein VMJ32_14005 [Pirellulales bacterium]|nr:hypothetical protein [Pirellulales bacterium]
MITNDSENQFISLLGARLQEKHPGLTIEVPASGVNVPTPDLIVINPSTGTSLALEVKSGFQSTHLPISAISQLRALRNSCQLQGKTDVVLVTTGEIPTLVKNGLAKSGISSFSVQTAYDAVDTLEPKLRELELG